MAAMGHTSNPPAAVIAGAAAIPATVGPATVVTAGATVSAQVVASPQLQHVQDLAEACGSAIDELARWELSAGT